MKFSFPLAALLALLAGHVAGDSSALHPCIAPHLRALPDGFRYGFPPSVEKAGVVIGDKRVPIHRKDVRDRILGQINYLLLDRRSYVTLWLGRADSYKTVMLPILRKYQLPPEFIYLAAIESGFDPRALSSAGAFGYWQFMKHTAQRGPAKNNEYDWKMQITKWKDERADLVVSTNSAAKYLTYMNRAMKVRLNGKEEREGFHDWCLTAAAYNAGPNRVTERLNSFGTESYWDVPLPDETEKYVPRWIALNLISKYRDFYGIRSPHAGAVVFDTVKSVTLKKDLSFGEMAHLLSTTPREIWSLNAQVPYEKAVFPARSGGRPVTHTINVPKGTGKKFLAQLKAKGFTTK